MNKSTWIPLALIVIVIVAAAMGGPYLFVQHQAAEQVPSEARHSPIPQTSASKEIDGTLTQRKLDGIGNTRDLKPIPIPQGAAR
jgi:flagellar basal body-associated protein FliL